LAKNSGKVKNKLWKNQAKESRMSKPDYFAAFWNEDNYSLLESPRESGDYSYQWCEVEVKLDG
jgi:hypothetical protein